MSSGDLNLNSVDRFRKNSDRLTLEQHGSCEVPAGCGGVVLRWHNPDSGQPVVFSCAVEGQVELFVNGQAIASRALLPFGETVIAIRLTQVDSSLPFLLAAWRDVPASDRRGHDDEEFVLPDGCSQPDGTWLCSELIESGDWMGAEYDDSNWTRLEQLNENLPEENGWRFDAVSEKSGQPLQLPASENGLCIRTRITVVRGVQ